MKSFVRKFCFTGRLMSTESQSYLKVPDVSKLLKTRPLQENFCEKASFCPPSELLTLASVGQYVSAQKQNSTYVVDLGESDFGSRANFGRGHNHGIFAAGCPTSFDSFLSRLGNIPCNELNTALADSLCILGSVDCQDLTVRCKGL